MHTFLISLELCIFSVIILSEICAGDDYRYEACVLTNCSSGPSISFPFYLPTQESYCGYPGFMISCREDGFPILQLSENDFVVEDIFYGNRSLRVYNAAVLESGCFPRIRNTTLPADKFRYASLANISLLSGCKNNISEELLRYEVGCVGEAENRILALYDGNRHLSNALEECKEHVVAAAELNGDERGDEVVDVSEVLRRGFVMNWLASDCSDCEESGGRCGFDVTSFFFRCFCPDRPHSRSCLPDSEGSKRNILIVTSSLVAGTLAVSLSLLLYFRKRKKLDHQLQKRALRRNYVKYHPNQSGEDLELPMFDLSTIVRATDNFSVNNKLGEGGFGPVYKGLKEDGQVIAVKRLSRTSHQGVDEFKNEVNCIAKLQHRNLVKLLGWCIQGEELMLVYEYMPNNSLDLVLFDPTTKSKVLDWPRRFNIINGIARGLMYLHQDSCLRVIHRDLKASNILLDLDMNPKISDFGLARTFDGNETGANTNRIVGTYGYMSPEYAGDGLFSVKSDVFSFGVIVLEIVSGKRNKRFCYRDHDLNILGYAWMHYREEKSLDLVDSCLINLYSASQVVRSIHVGLLCVQEHPDDRPTMSSVVMMLTNDDVVLPQPKHPGFFTQRHLIKPNILDSSITESSRNRITTYVLEGR